METYADVRMAAANGLTLSADTIMDTARGGLTLKQGGLQMWEKQLIESSEVRRKATVAQLCKTPRIDIYVWVLIGGIRLSRLLFPNFGIPRGS